MRLIPKDFKSTEAETANKIRKYVKYVHILKIKFIFVFQKFVSLNYLFLCIKVKKYIYGSERHDIFCATEFCVA